MAVIDVRCGKCETLMAEMEPGTVDAIVTDPPYALTANKKGGTGIASGNPSTPYGRARISTGNGAGGFMGKRWDDKIPGPEIWSEALRVAKPGAHLVAFGGTRTFHRLICAIEDGGWEIRDCLLWMYGQGFPKSRNLEGEHEGWGTGLKPGWEPICLARKSLEGTVEQNMRKYGIGALNIATSRIEANGRPLRLGLGEDTDGKNTYGSGGPGGGSRAIGETDVGRWPANVVLDEESAMALDAQTDILSSGMMRAGSQRSSGGGYHGNFSGEATAKDTYGDCGGASRFFYCAKASQAERNGGVEKNSHPTVKPVSLMRWLVKLVTPPGGLVLDPFAGSFTTGIACVLENYRFVGFDESEDYCAIGRGRLAHAMEQPTLWTP